MAGHRLRAVYSAELEVDAEDWARRGDRLIVAPVVARDGVRPLAVVEVAHVQTGGSLTVRSVSGTLAIGEQTAMIAPLPGDPRPAVRRAVLRGPLSLVGAEED